MGHLYTVQTSNKDKDKDIHIPKVNYIHMYRRLSVISEENGIDTTLNENNLY